MSSDTNSLAHTKWNCKYHIVFAPKYRRQVIYGKIKKDIGIILRQLCERKGVEIIEAEACKDHIHMLVSIPPKLGVSSFVGYLKGKSSLMIFDRHANLKYRYGNRKFWCKGFYVDTVGRNKKVIENYIRNQLQEDIVADVDTVGRNKKVIENYIRNQLQEDIVADQISMEEYLDPFTGEKNKKRKKKE
ncbi:IS200/IS605 family transposase [Staphylococcus aureus]|nr:IS200/IS605 family transposase [Staphylococcus aureus]QOE17867.1 IS200/IS605 family transposase [Staphylococcus aureus]